MSMGHSSDKRADRGNGTTLTSEKRQPVGVQERGRLRISNTGKRNAKGQGQQGSAKDCTNASAAAAGRERGELEERTTPPPRLTPNLQFLFSQRLVYRPHMPFEYGHAR